MVHKGNILNRKLMFECQSSHDPGWLPSPLFPQSWRGPSRLFFSVDVERPPSPDDKSTVTDWRGEEEEELKKQEEAERAEVRRDVATLFPSHVHGASKSPLSKKPRKRKIISSVFSEGAKKNHFVSLTFVACFYFLIELFFFFFNCLFYKKWEKLVRPSCIANIKSIGMHW